ncbi:hypothetical protein ASZ90_010138 [hydrocarbon metagenome]|uniref:Glycosyltransferase 2-like domain-containing protein n=1 Tax=hydrocarbon metagenome TaxID=938273 RepID=A0A0W8FH98_9ZZZZ
MFKNRTIAVIVPAYNEELLIGETLDTIPAFVDRIYVVNDCSTDRTQEMIEDRQQRDSRIVFICHKENGGVGAAIVTGYKRSLDDGIEIAAVMAGDNQMDPAHLSKLLDPIVDGAAEFTKGNRLKYGYWKGMSRWRLFGNLLLNFLNKIASGYWGINDPQNGYTGVSAAALSKLDLDALYPRFAFENDMMIKSNVAGIPMMNVDIPARYGRETSHIRYGSFILETSYFLLKSFFWRVVVKFLRYQHPIYLAYVLGMSLMILGGITTFFGEWWILPFGVALFVTAGIAEARQAVRPMANQSPIKSWR